MSSRRNTAVSPKIVAPVATRSVDHHVELAVLGTAPLDDVHLGHDLDSADEFGPDDRRQGQDLTQRTVDAEADADATVGWLDVDVRGAVANRLGDDLVDQLDHRCVVVDDQFRLLLGCGGRPELADVVVAFGHDAVVGVEGGDDVARRSEVDVDRRNRQGRERLADLRTRAVCDGD